MANIDLLGPASAPAAVTQRPTESRQFGQTDTWFQPCSSPSSPDGTQLQAVWMNGILAQVRYALRASGIPLDNADDGMLWAAIKSALLAAAPPEALWHSGLAGGTPQLLTVPTIKPAISDYSAAQLPCLITTPFPPAANSRIKIGTLDDIPILRADGTPIQTADIIAGDMFGSIRGGAFRLIGLGRAQVQQIVTNVTLFVRTDGNDSNDGSANDPAHAFRTLTAAFASAIRFSNTSTVAIQLGMTGTYDAPNALPKTGASFQINGDANNPSQYNISGPGTTNIPPITVGGVSLSLNGVQINNTGTINNTIGAILGGSVSLTNCILTAITATSNYHVSAFAGGSVLIGQGVIFASSMGGMVSANGGSIVLGGAIATANGPRWSTGGVAAVGNGSISIVPGTSFSGSGAFGPRYYVTTNGTINTNFAGENYLPGDAAGIKQTGGQYV